MLKLKDSVSLSELETFGFEEFYCGKESCFVFPKGVYNAGDVVSANEDCVIVNGSCMEARKGEREIIVTFSNMNYETFINVSKRSQLDILYLLIKADLVEKVEND